ncbi:hypothetical protein MUA90_06425 [Staphylococcus sp. IVB6181]|uniref:hypothetical protein n=1 Tax=Staphylococcus sp. IVB6181 TaxID=2929481 RepID=UPI0021D37F68|nr:hypothetical protein [Staphylococcus sp. IVB6181]UXV36088.1 hypothetical protein MUA90_06425 [Staphylococcus sp. IVB6181]
MKNWLKNNRFIMILVALYITGGFLLLPSLGDYFNKSYFDHSILKVIIDSFMAIVGFALSLSLGISFVLSVIVMTYQYFKNDNVENVIKEFAFVVVVINVYVFICTLALLSITTDNGEAIFALFGFIYGFTKYLLWAYNLINNYFKKQPLQADKK